MPTLFVRPADLPSALLALAESMWATSDLETLRQVDDWDLLLATLLGLDADENAQHDELTRCHDCRAWFWAEDGATVTYETGRDLTMCDVHAVPDDPGARVYPGVGLEAAWRDRDDAEMSARIRETGRAW